MVEHSSITDPEIHEPKGVSAASSGQVYTADGAGSGDWAFILPHGWGLYDDNLGAKNLSTSEIKLLNDGAAADTDETHLPLEIRGSSSLWNVSTNKLTPIAQGDSYLVEIYYDVTAVGASPTGLIFRLDRGGAATATDVLAARQVTLKGTPTYKSSVQFSFVVDATMFTNGLQIFVKTDTGTATINDVHILINRLYSGDL